MEIYPNIVHLFSEISLFLNNIMIILFSKEDKQMKGENQKKIKKVYIFRVKIRFLSRKLKFLRNNT